MAPLFTGLRLGFGRSAEVAGIILPAIGSAYEGGFFAGTISHTANGVATHALIVAPAATERYLFIPAVKTIDLSSSCLPSIIQETPQWLTTGAQSL